MVVAQSSSRRFSGRVEVQIDYLPLFDYAAVGPEHYGMDLQLPENGFRFRRWIQQRAKTGDRRPKTSGPSSP
jgi:hypothetical protein